MIITKYTRFLESLKIGKDMWDVIPDSVKELHKIFKSSGKDLHLIGGSVRDFLTGHTPKDFDLATDATPDEIKSIIGRKWRTTEQGKAFGVIVVYTEDQPKGMEIATFREDLYGDLLGKTRNPEVKFSTVEKDVERRDLTWNALYYDLDRRTIVDLVNGIEDLKNGVTRFVGDPDMRIKEDPLRILRLVRFSSRYGFDIEERTRESIEKNKEQLGIIVQNRIWEEFHKAYGQVKDFTLYLKLVDEFDLWKYIFPGFHINHDIVKCSSIELYISNLLTENNNLLTDPTKVQEMLVQDCLVPATIAREVAFLLWLQDFTPERITEFYAKKNSYKISDEMIREWFDIIGLAGVNWYDAFIKYRPTTSSQELMNQGFKGKALGDKIKEIETEKFKQLI
jgi:tRNA nucleotidyltransferase/poly(A) polymerase